MTHPPHVVDEALRLAGDGVTALNIAERTGVPRGTIVDWIAGRVPRRAGRTSHPRCPSCGSTHQQIGPLDDWYVYLLGLYLGDGCISKHPRGVYKLRIALDAAYPGIIRDAATAMGICAPGASVNRVKGKGECFEVYAYSKAWPCLFPQHGPGVKHKRPIALAPWQDVLVSRWVKQFLRGLIHSDGCRFINTGRGGWRHPRYCFDNQSEDIRGIFCYACDLLGLRWTVANQTIYVSRKTDVAHMDEFIGPKA